MFEAAARRERDEQLSDRVGVALPVRPTVADRPVVNTRRQSGFRTGMDRDERTVSVLPTICGVRNSDYPNEPGCSLGAGHDRIADPEDPSVFYDHARPGAGAWWNEPDGPVHHHAPKEACRADCPASDRYLIRTGQGSAIVSSRRAPALSAVTQEHQHPAYYNQVPGVECWDVAKYFSFLRGNAIKYLWRAGAKGNVRADLLKAREYIDAELAELDGE